MQKTNRSLLYIQALFWIVMAGFYLLRFENWIMPLLLAADGLGFFLLGLLYPKHKALRLLALLYLAFNLLLTLTDQMGAWDFAYLALAAASFLMILIEMRGSEKKK